MKSFYIKTLGCKTNQIESNLMTEQLVNAGFEMCKKDELFDIFILNSCSVTSNADREAIKILKKVKRDCPHAMVVLTGCMAQLEAQKLQEAEFVDLVLGNSEKMNISKYINSVHKVNVGDIFSEKEFIYKKIENPNKTRAYLKVQDGCNNQCSYCTIWRARGKSRSMKINDVVEQVQTYVEHGFDEIVLTGIHIGQWGGDLENNLSFIDLVKIINDSDIKRFRLGSLDPFELNGELVEYLAKSEKFCPHFHLSLQSMCDKTLKAMNRHYSVSHAIELIKLINSKFNLPFIGSDIIVGFPDEAENDFEITCQNIENSGLTMAHVFPYSIRKNTVAATMTNQIDKNVKHNRLVKLKSIVNKKYNDFVQKNIGTIHSVTFEKNKTRNGLYKGLTDNYLTVYSASDEQLGGKFCNCKILENNDNGLICKVV